MLDYIKSTTVSIITLVGIFSPYLIGEQIRREQIEQYNLQMLEQQVIQEQGLKPPIQTSSTGQTKITILKGMNREPLFGPI